MLIARGNRSPGGVVSWCRFALNCRNGCRLTVVICAVVAEPNDIRVSYSGRKWKIEQYLGTLGLHLNVIRPTFFMDKLFELLRPTVEDDVCVVWPHFPTSLCR